MIRFKKGHSSFFLLREGAKKVIYGELKAMYVLYQLIQNGINWKFQEKNLSEKNFFFFFIEIFFRIIAK